MLNLVLKKLKLVKQTDHNKILNANKKLQETNVELVEKLADTKRHLNRLKALQGDLDALNTTNKKLHKNVKRLLTKKRELKEQNNYLTTKVLYLETYVNGLTDKLEYLCFGSVLPKVMRKANINNYQHLFKPVNIEYHLSKTGHYHVIANLENKDDPRK